MPKTMRGGASRRPYRVRVFDEHWADLGEMDVSEARKLARARGLDLVEVAPDARPPICRIMSHSQFKREAKVGAKPAAPPRVTNRPRDIALRPGLTEREMAAKLQLARRHFANGLKVAVTIRKGGAGADAILGAAVERLRDVAEIEHRQSSHRSIDRVLLRPK